MKPYLIINPTAAYGKMRERWRTIEPILREEHFAFDSVFTEYHLHAIELTRAAIRAGYDLIVSVGGDGTLNEVVNGLFDEAGALINPEVVVGVIPSGTGGDFFRTANIPRDPIVAARQLIHATQTRVIDLGEMIFERDGKTTRRFFANAAGIGFDAQVAQRVEERGKHIGGTIPYYTALIETIWKYRNQDAVLRFENEIVEGRFNDIIVCNGKFLGGGMQVSPHSRLDDGILEVITIGDMGHVEVVLNTPRLYNGTILEHPKVREYHVRTVTIEPRQTMMSEADGELIGPGPVTFHVRPATLRLRV